MTSIIRDLREIDIDINLQYRNSKLPKFIKKIIAGMRRKKLHTLINGINDIDQVAIRLLEEYIKIVLDTYPPYGRYRNCSKVSINNDGSIATFINHIDDKRLAIMMINFSFNLTEGDERIIIIRYTYMIDGKTKFSFGESVLYSGFLVRDNDVINDISSTNSSEVQRKIIKNICIDSLHEDIVYFLREMIERSERVYKI